MTKALYDYYAVTAKCCIYFGEKGITDTVIQIDDQENCMGHLKCIITHSGVIAHNRVCEGNIGV